MHVHGCTPGTYYMGTVTLGHAHIRIPIQCTLQIVVYKDIYEINLLADTKRGSEGTVSFLEWLCRCDSHFQPGGRLTGQARVLVCALGACMH